MTHDDPSRTPPRRIASIVVVGVLVVAASAAALGLAQPASSSPPAAGQASSSAAAAASPVSSTAPAVVPTAVIPDGRRGELAAHPGGALPGGDGLAPGVADGVLTSRATALDDGLPGVANLDPALLTALRSASTDARHAGVRLHVASGWRSRQYQEQLFHQAVTEYGSEAEAARWVAIPGTSTHESGNAVDIGPSAAEAWLSKHGAAYGLCQIYRNEPWHYELRPEAIDRGCPTMFADSAHDPRMER